MRKFLALFSVLLLSITVATAQSRTITGKVTDESNQPVEGASVVIKGTSTGVAADAQGNFRISAKNGDVLVISATNFGSKEYTIAASTTNVDVKLTRGTAVIDEVVVTALGVRRTRNTVPYAAQTINGDEVSKTRTSNFINNLSGKVSGLETRQNNGLGASTNVVLRGVKSITGDNQALFVVDGVPYNNANNNNNNNTSIGTTQLNQKSGGGGYDYGNAAADINPDDIESITVLKGAAASALYGSIGANGVILITTKKGRRGIGVTVNSSVSLGSVDKKTLPKYQHSYGGGYGAYYEDPTGRFLYRDINGDGINDLVTPLSEDASFGAAFDPAKMVYQWDAFDPSSPYFGKARPWIAGANDPNSFFEKPVSTNNSIFFNAGNEKQTFKLGYTRTTDKGFLPNSKITKNAIDLSSTYGITSKLTAGAAINFSNVSGLGRYGTGYDGAGGRNQMTSFREWWQMNVDVEEQKAAYERSGGKNVTWNWADPTALVPIYWDNPYFMRMKNYETDARNRYFGNVNLNYKLTDWLNVMGRISVDNFSELQEERKAVGSVGTPYYSRYDHSWNETNFDLLLNMDKNVSADLNLKALLGANIRKQHDQSVYARTNNGLVVPNFYSLANSVSAPSAPVEYDGRREVDGVFAGATLAWRNMLTLDATIRRDQSSTLPEGNNTYYYPSASLGFAFSQLLKTTPWLSYGKVRINYAQVGNDAPIYSVYDIYKITDPFGSNPQTFISTTKNNAELKPERTRSFEVGLEAAFLKNRVGFDLTYYKARSIDQIVPVTLSTATGYSRAFFNSGTVENRGVELTLYGSPVQTKNFSWNINLNWTRNRNEVIALFKDASGQEAKNLSLSNFQGGITINASLGEAYGTIRGTNFVYTNGEKTIGTNGRYIKANGGSSNEVIGNINPDWLGGINNSFRYKNVSFSFLIDIRQGGSVFSTDMYYGLATGLYEETAVKNSLGNPIRNPLQLIGGNNTTPQPTSGGFVRPGVLADGKPNNIWVSSSNYGAFGYSVNPDAAFVYDASYVKLREAVLTYSLPATWITKLKYVKGIDLSLIGKNLWIIHKNLPYSDPEEGFSSGNLQGVQTGAYPTLRTFTFNVKLNF
jgi:TonB-linked SusC/RagA family outer membrane protein